jgi:beta-phosphoglucomutase-like phosphatase (HAD superfamily)
MAIKRTSHAVYDTKYHLVWTPKYRKWVLRGDVQKRGEKSKPPTDIFAAALKEVGPPPVVDVIVVGDTPYDAEAAGKLRVCEVVWCSGIFRVFDNTSSDYNR